MLNKFSLLLASFERIGAVACAAAITLLILLNVVTRALNHALFWVDELAIYAMVWMLFFSIALLLKKRQLVAVTFLSDFSPPLIKKLLAIAVDYITLIFSVFLLYFAWDWFKPLDLASVGFDYNEFSAKTMNFIYQEKSNTLNINKFWVWLIIPYFSISVFVHALTNILYKNKGNK